MTVEFVDRMGVQLIDWMGGDSSIPQAARVSTGSDEVERWNNPGLSDGDRRLVRRLIRDRHTSTLEHTAITLRLDVPIFVAREWMRHRTQSYNEISARYAVMEPTFYTPPADRPLVQYGKPMDYRRKQGTWWQRWLVGRLIRHTAHVTARAYDLMLRAGIAREVARMVLPVNLMTRFYATANLSNWLKFLDLRTDQAALDEIRRTAHEVEKILTDLYPEAVKAWKANR